MKVCSRCKQQLNDTDMSCPRCGSKSFMPMQPNNMYQQSPQQNWQQGQPQQMQQSMNNMNQQQAWQNQPMQNQPMQNQPGWNGQQQYQQQYNQNVNNQQPNIMRPNMQAPGNNMGQPIPNEPDPLAMTAKNKKKLFGKDKTPQQQMAQQQIYGAPTQQGNPNAINNQQTYNQQTYNQQAYGTPQQPYGQPNTVDPLQVNATDMTVSDWIKTMLIMLVPIYNLVFIVKGMNNVNYPMYKRNYFKAYLIYFLASFGISLIFALLVTLL